MVKNIKTTEKFDTSYMKRDDFIGKLRENAKDNDDSTIELQKPVKRNGVKIEQPSVIEVKPLKNIADVIDQDEIDKKLCQFIKKRETEMRGVAESEGHFNRWNRAEYLMNEHLKQDKYTSAFAYMGVRDVSQKLTPPEYDIVPKKASSMFSAKILLEALENELDKAKYTLNFDDGYWNTCVYGENFRLISLHDSDIDGYYGLAIDNLKPKEILIDERCRQFVSPTGKGDAVDCLIKFQYSYEDFINDINDKKININGKTYDLWKNTNKIVDGAILEPDNKGSGSRFIEVWYYYNRVQDRQVIMLPRDVILRDIPLFTRIGKRKCLPLVRETMFRIAGSNRYQGIPDLVYNLDVMKNKGMRLGAEHALEMGKTMTFVNSASDIDMEALANRDPFVKVFVPQGADPNSLFMQHQMQPLGSEYYNLIEQTLSNDAVARIGSDFTTFSQETRHASTQIQRSEYTDSMARSIMKRNELEAETNFLRMVICLMVDSFNDEKWKELLSNETFNELVKTIEDTKSRSIRDYLLENIDIMDIKVEVGSMVEPNRQAKRQQLTDAMMVIQPNNPMYNVVVKDLLTTIIPARKLEIEGKFAQAEEMANQQLEQTKTQTEMMKQGGDMIPNKQNNLSNSTMSNGGTGLSGNKMSGNTTQQIVQRGLSSELKNGSKNTAGKTI